MNKIKMQVDERKLIANMKDAFSNDYSVITELAQNARRAGATKVTFKVIEMAEKEDGCVSKFDLQVTDNGSGIDDMQSLLSVASSGWDAETVAEEQPFGMGFLIAVYCSDAIEVRSKGKVFKATKKQLLNLEEIAVTDCNLVTSGTEITLKGLSLKDVSTFEDFCELINKLLYCFPIEVNVVLGEYYDASRALSNGSIPFLEDPKNNFTKKSCGIGDVFYHEQILVSGRFNVVPVYQGLLVEKLQGYGGFTNAYSFSRQNDHVPNMYFHLNSSAGTIRLPDRDSFLNNTLVSSKITEVLHELTREAILSKRNDYSFLEANIGVLKGHKLLGLLNSHNCVPKEFYSSFSGFNIQNKENDYEGLAEWMLDNHAYVVTKECVQNFTVILMDSDMEDNFLVKELPLENAFAAVFALEQAYTNAYVLVEEGALDADHWIYKNTVKFAGVASTVKVSVTGPRDHRVKLENFYPEVAPQLCENFEISINIDGKEYSTGKVDDEYCIATVGDDTVALFPKDFRNNSGATMAMAICTDDNRGYTDDKIVQEYEQALDSWLRLEHVFEDPTKLILSYLGDADLKHLSGQEFKLLIKGSEIVIEHLTGT